MIVDLADLHVSLVDDYSDNVGRNYLSVLSVVAYICGSKGRSRGIMLGCCIFKIFFTDLMESPLIT